MASGSASTHIPFENLIHACVECGKSSLYPDPHRGEYICIECGAVYDRLQVEQGKKAFTSEEITSRSTTHFEPEKKIGTRTTFNPNQIIGGPTPETLSRYSRILKYNTTARTGIETNYRFAAPTFALLKSQLNLPDYVERLAWNIYTKAVEKKLARGRSIPSLAAASVYASLRHFRMIRMPEEMSFVLGLKDKSLEKTHSLLTKEVLGSMNIEKGHFSASDYLVYVLNRENLSEHISPCIKALRMIPKSRLKKLVGRDPKGIAAGIAYSWCNHKERKITQDFFADAFYVTEVTVRNGIKLLKKHCSLEAILDEVSKECCSA